MTEEITQEQLTEIQVVKKKKAKKHKDASAKRQARLFLLRPNAYYLLLNQFPTPAP